ncbi:MAG: 3-methylcrotonyl-CoA carboxylase, biotin-containing alpha subunit [Pseudomonadota bacterium]|jgi:biotin carboxyl carrier protein
MKRRFVDPAGDTLVVSSAGAAGPHHVAAGAEDALQALPGALTRAGNGDLLLEHDGIVRRVRVTAAGDALWADRGGKRLALRREEQQRGGKGGTGDSVASPMTGRVVLVHVAVGDVVTKGQPLVVVEAMKMEQPLAAPRDGVVAAVRCEAGQLVDGGIELVSLAPEEAA